MLICWKTKKLCLIFMFFFGFYNFGSIILEQFSSETSWNEPQFYFSQANLQLHYMDCDNIFEESTTNIHWNIIGISLYQKLAYYKQYLNVQLSSASKSSFFSAMLHHCLFNRGLLLIQLRHRWFMMFSMCSLLGFMFLLFLSVSLWNRLFSGHLQNNKKKKKSMFFRIETSFSVEISI